MVAEYEGKTNLQGSRATDVYIGKWVKIRGPISEVSELSSGNLHVLVSTTDHPSTDYHSLYVSLEFPRLAPLETANLGDIIEALGRIEKVRAQAVSLLDCDLLSIKPPE